MKPVSWTPAESTVLRLQQAAHDGSPVMIPGAWAVRPARPAAPLIGGTETRTMRAAESVVVFDRERLEREREGGGAPSARSRRTSFLARLWRAALHPTEIGALWSPLVPQPR